MTLRILGVLALLLPAPVIAADALEASLGICASCHGANGRPSDATIPVINGQQARYLEKQLADYRSGDRDSQIMSSMAEAIPFKDLARAAELLASRPWPAPMAASGGAEPAAAGACKGCHGNGFEGGQSPEGWAPRLAGQSVDYLADQMGAFARGDRAKPATMTSMMTALPEEERKQIAAFLGAL